MASFHPHPELLIDYAAGTTAGAAATLMATHLVLCPACRAAVAELEEIGGILLEGLDGHPVATVAAALPLGRAPAPLPATTSGPAILPKPLRDRLGRDLDQVRWRGLFPGVRYVGIPGLREGAATLMKISAGRRLPQHTHRGTEMTLVLAGGFSDLSGHYGRGDLLIADPGIDHQPVADADGDCICLVVAEAPPRFTGRFGPILNLFTAGR